MSTVSSVIDTIRLSLNDSDAESRWTDANLLALVKNSIERMNHLLMRANVDFAKATVHTFSTADGTATYALPTDFMAKADGLFRRDWQLPLAHYTDEQWERELSTATTVRWRISGSNIEIGYTPDAVVSMAFYYWPKIDTSEYTTASTMPWGGRMDQPIAEYVAIRCMNIDEMDITTDAQMLNDITGKYIADYASNTAPVSVVAGYYDWGRDIA